MDDQNSIDLKHLNKKPNQNILHKLRSIKSQKKSSGTIKRDKFGQFSSDSGGLKTFSRFNIKKSLPLILAFVVVGSIYLIRSFAATSTPIYPYQYSMYVCAGFNNASDPTSSGSKTPPDYTCTDQSAESVIYRIHRGLQLTSPSAASYNAWVQKLAGDRLKPQDYASEVLSASIKKNLSNQVFIESLYKDMHGVATYDTAKVSTYKQQLDLNQKTRPQIVYEFSNSAEAKTYSRAPFVVFRSPIARVTVTQTAAAKQLARVNEAKTLNSGITTSISEISKRTDATNTFLKNAEALNPKPANEITIKNVTDTEDAITFIAELVSQMKQKTWHSDITTKYNRIKVLDTEAKAVAAYSPDISAATMKPELDYATTMKTLSDGSYAQIDAAVVMIKNSLIYAEAKYQSELEIRGRFVASAYKKLQTDMPVGVKHWMDDSYTNKKIHVVKIDLSNPKVKLRASTYAERGKTPTEFAWATGSIAAINADYRNLSNSTDYVPSGVAVGNGAQWTGSSDKSDSTYFACKSDNSCSMEKRLTLSANPSGFSSVIAGGGGLSGVLLEPGFAWSLKPGDPGCATDQENTCRDQHPRTAIGLSLDKKTMWWVMVEGRQPGYDGLSFYDLTALFKKLNAKWALNLDGGGSSGMVVKGKLVNGRPTNEPTERKVTNALGVYVLP